MSDVLEKTALYREAQSQPRPYDPEGVKREVQILVDDVVVQLPGGVRAPALIPGEHSARYAARADEMLIPFLPPEGRDVNRRALPFRDVAEILRVDLELARKEIDNPNFSLADGEIREVIRLDDAGRPTSCALRESAPKVMQFEGVEHAGTQRQSIRPR
jgi:hypothetical protein